MKKKRNIKIKIKIKINGAWAATGAKGFSRINSRRVKDVQQESCCSACLGDSGWVPGTFSGQRPVSRTAHALQRALRSTVRVPLLAAPPLRRLQHVLLELALQVPFLLAACTRSPLYYIIFIQYFSVTFYGCQMAFICMTSPPPLQPTSPASLCCLAARICLFW